MRGEAFYEGTRVWFADLVYSPYGGEPLYLIIYEGARWVRQSQLTSIVYHID